MPPPPPAARPDSKYESVAIERRAAPPRKDRKREPMLRNCTFVAAVVAIKINPEVPQRGSFVCSGKAESSMALAKLPRLSRS